MRKYWGMRIVSALLVAVMLCSVMLVSTWAYERSYYIEKDGIKESTILDTETILDEENGLSKENELDESEESQNKLKEDDSVEELLFGASEDDTFLDETIYKHEEPMVDTFEEEMLSDPHQWGTQGVQKKINDIYGTYSQNSFFSTDKKACTHGQLETCSKCRLSNIDANAASICGDGWTCFAFARYVFYHLFGMKANADGNIKIECYSSEINNKAVLGDFVACLNSDGSEPHNGIYLGGSGDTFYLYESNYGQANKVNYTNGHQTTEWPRYRIFHASNYDQVNATQSENPYVISNGVLTKYNGDSETVTIPDGVTKIATGCFDESNKNKPEDIHIKYINFPNSLTEIEGGAFYHCRNLSSVNLPDSLKILHEKAFEGCTINKLRIPAEVKVKTNPIYEGQDWFSGPFYATSINQIEWASGINKIPDYLFSYSELIMDTLIIPNTVTEIGTMAFYAWNGTSMKKVILPSNLNRMGKRAFYDCKRLESIEIPSKIATIPEQCFSYCGIKSLTIPSNVNIIEEGAFEYCELESIFFPASTITLHSRAFRSTKIQSFTLSDNILLALDSDGFATSPFYECELLKTIIFSSSCRTIPDYMFASCESLETLTIPDQITTIGKMAFSSCKGLKTVIIGSGVTSIGDQAFSGCTRLESIAFGENLTSIGEMAFDYCISLKEIHLPNRVTSLGESVFWDCEQLETAELGNSLQKLPTYAFQDCTSLSFVDLPDTVTEIGAGAFSGCISLTEVYYPANIKKIGSGAFARCTKLKRVVMPDSLEEIGDYCYEDCSNLKTIMFSSNMKNVPYSAFYNCTSLREVKLPNGLTKIGDSAFGGCPNLVKVVVPKTVKEIGYLAFFNSDQCVIYGEYGSYADRYARNRGIPFVSVNGTDEITAIKVTPSSGRVVLFEDEWRMVSFTTDAGYIPETKVNIQSNAGSAFLYKYDGEGYIYLTGKSEGEGTLTISIDEIQTEIRINVIKAVLQFKDQDGADMDIEEMNIKYGEKYPVLPVPEKENHDFIGWYTQEGIKGSKITEDSYFRGVNTLYAGWIKNDEMIRILPQEEYEYSGEMIKPSPIVYSGNTLLKEGEDYTITYQNTTNAGDGDSNKPPTVLIKGKGDYTKQSSLCFTILPKELGNGTDFNDDFTATISDKQYNEKEQISKPTIKLGKTTLKENKDYTLAYRGDRVNPGDVTVTVIGVNGGNFTGSAQLTYTIFEKDKGLSTAYIDAIPNQTYSGQAVDLVDLPIVVKESKKSENALVRGEDYDVFFATGADKVNVGTVSILIQGKGTYCGTKMATFKIVPAKMDHEMIAVENIAFTGNQVKPSVSVTLGGEIVDPSNYTVTYKNNTKAEVATAGRKAPTVTVKGKGNLSGNAEATFTIAPLVLTQADLNISVPDIKDNGKEIGNSAIKPTVKYGNPTTHKVVTLKKGTDYDVTFTRANAKEMQTVNIILKGNYKNTEDISAKFRIYGTQTVLNRTDFIIEEQGSIPVYSGSKILLPLTVKTTVDGEEQTLTEGKDYTVGYTNNINAADKDLAAKKPTWKITGKGAYKGTVSGTFTIAPYTFTEENFTVTVADVKNNGNDQKPKLTVINNTTGKALKTSDFTAVYGSTKVSTDDAQVTITGQGNYTGNLTGHFRVYDKSITTAVFEKIDNMPYTGRRIMPNGDLVVAYADKNKTIKLQEGVDYTLSYGDNVKAGTGTVIVTGIGDYGGSKTIKFTIVPKWLQWLL